jgi:endoglucanase
VWLWKELSSRYADDPYIAGYDILNEPGYGLTAEEINGYYSRVITAIREKDRHHILFLEGTDFGRDFTKIKDPEDPLIAYTVHFYPFVLDEDVLDPEMDAERRRKIFRGIFERQIREISGAGRPVWCGESGYEILDGREEFYASLLLENIALCEEKGISWNLWTYKDARRMGIVVPRKDSPWIAMREEIAGQWSHDREQKTSMEITRYIGDTYYQSMDKALAYDLDFRIRSVLHTVAVEQILKPFLRKTPWEEMKDYPASFLFERCDRKNMITEMISERIRSREKQ